VASVPNLHLAHTEIRVERLGPMVDFYTKVLRFVITDASTGPNAMVFLSRSPDEHHQIVLATNTDNGMPTRVDHIAFRLESLEDLQTYRRVLDQDSVECASHGTAWSFYLHDPDGNRLEFFADTPWHVEQPARWAINLDSEAASLRQQTLRRVQRMSDYAERSTWEAEHRVRLRRNPQRRIAPAAVDPVAKVLITTDDDGDPTGDNLPMSSHRTSQGILTYYRQPCGNVIARLCHYR